MLHAGTSIMHGPTMYYCKTRHQLETVMADFASLMSRLHWPHRSKRETTLTVTSWQAFASHCWNQTRISSVTWRPTYKSYSNVNQIFSPSCVMVREEISECYSVLPLVCN